MGEGERDKGEKNPGLQGIWFDEATHNLARVSDNLARFDGDGNPVTRDDWIEGIFQVGNVPDLNDREDGWVQERFINPDSTSVTPVGTELHNKDDPDATP